MSSVGAAPGLSMASLYAMMGLAMPSGVGDAGSSPALAMLSAANESRSVELSALLGGLGGSAGASSPSSLTSALLSLTYLDPAAELERLQGTVAAAGQG